jgi:hypothetical protein
MWTWIRVQFFRFWTALIVLGAYGYFWANTPEYLTCVASIRRLKSLQTTVKGLSPTGIAVPTTTLLLAFKQSAANKDKETKRCTRNARAWLCFCRMIHSGRNFSSPSNELNKRHQGAWQSRTRACTENPAGMAWACASSRVCASSKVQFGVRRRRSSVGSHFGLSNQAIPTGACNRTM